MKQISVVLATSLSLILLFTFQNCSEIQSGEADRSLVYVQKPGVEKNAAGPDRESFGSDAEVNLLLREIEGVLPTPKNLDIKGNSPVLLDVRVSGLGMNDLAIQKTVTLADLYQNEVSLQIPRGGGRLIQVTAKIPVSGMEPLEFYGKQEVDISSSIVSLIFPVRYRPPMPI